jgi:hypothetical protein
MSDAEKIAMLKLRLDQIVGEISVHGSIDYRDWRVEKAKELLELLKAA